MILTRPLLAAGTIGGVGSGALTATALSGISLSSQNSQIESQKKELDKLNGYKGIKSVEEIAEIVRAAILLKVTEVNTDIQKTVADIKALQQNVMEREKILKLREDKVDQSQHRLCWIFEGEEDVCHRPTKQGTVIYGRR